MKKRNLLTLSVIALLASCNNTPATYNTRVDLPKGGVKVEDEVRNEKAVELFSKVLNFNEGGEKEGLSGNLKFDVTVDVNIKEDDATSAVHVAVSGGINYFCSHTNNLEKDETDAILYSTVAGLQLKDFTVNVSYKENGKSVLDLGINKLNLAVYYAYDINAEDGYVFLDLSHRSVYTNVVNVAKKVMALSGMNKDATELYMSMIKSYLDLYLVEQGGKFFASQSGVKQLLADPAVAEKVGNTTVTLLNKYLDGDAYDLLKSMALGMIDEDAKDEVKEGLPVIIAVLPYVLNSYNEGEEYGFGFNVTDQTILPVVQAAAELDDQHSDSGSEPLEPAPFYAPDDEDEEKELVIPFKLRFGFAAMFGKKHGTKDYALESFNARFDFKMNDNSVKAHGYLTGEFYYNELVTDLFDNKSKEYENDLVEIASGMMQQDDEGDGE